MLDSCSIISLFEERAAAQPEAEALLFQDRRLTYAQLNFQANLIARELIHTGIGPGRRVGIHLERSPEVVIAILAVLKTGAAYLALDPAYPAERLTFMMQDAGIGALLSTAETPPLPTSHTTLRVLNPASLLESAKRGAVSNPANSPQQEDTAYLMYTSGSTGRPKGVVMSQSAVLTYLHSINRLLKVSSSDTYLHTASFSFSSSIRQLFLPLLNGSRLVLAEPGQQRSLPPMLELIKACRVTIADTVQSVWKQGLPELAGLGQVKRRALLNTDLRLLIFSGDQLPCQVVHSIREVFKGKSPAIVNLYGQTETLGGCAYSLPDDYAEVSGYVPIGHPLPHYGAHLLDANLKNIETGQAGELYASGGSLADEYLNNPQLSSQAFILNHGVPGLPIRLYKTGDMARLGPNSLLEILGRSDFQVKLHGIRIELSEIEAVLALHPRVQESVVLARRNPKGEKLLVGYFVADQPGAVSGADLKLYAAGKLPDHMIPFLCLEISELPLTPNGKVNRRQLPEPDWSALGGRHYVAPEDQIEVDLAYLYAQLLGIEKVGLHDNFFDLGGDSLSAVRLVTMAGKLFNKELALELLYQAPTVKELSVQVEKGKTFEPWRRLVSLQPLGDRFPLFCVHGDDGNFFLPTYLGQDYPFFGFFHQGRDGSRVKHTTIKEIAAQYIEEIRQIRPKGPYLLSGFSIGGLIAYEMAQQFLASGQEVPLLALIDTSAPRLDETKLVGEHIYDSVKGRLVAKPHNDTGADTEKRPGFADRLISYCRRRAEKMLYPLFLATGFTMPLALRGMYIMEIYRKARICYQPSPYPGPVLLFRSTVDNFSDYTLGWHKLVEGDLRIHEIRGSHLTLIKPPQVSEVARTIREEMDRLWQQHN